MKSGPSGPLFCSSVWLTTAQSLCYSVLTLIERKAMHPSISLSPALRGLYEMCETARYIDPQTVQALDEIADTLLCNYSAVVVEKAKCLVESGRLQMCCIALWRSVDEEIDDITRALPYFSSYRTSEVLREFTWHVEQAYSAVFSVYCRSLSPTGELPVWWSRESTRKAKQERIELLTDFHAAVLQSSVSIREVLQFI